MKIGELIEKIRYHPRADDFPDYIWEEINSIEDWEVYSSREALPGLANYESEDPDLDSLLEEAYEVGVLIARLREFADSVWEDPYTPRTGPIFTIDYNGETIEVYPIWQEFYPVWKLMVVSEGDEVRRDLLSIAEEDIMENRDKLGELIVERLREFIEKNYPI